MRPRYPFKAVALLLAAILMEGVLLTIPRHADALNGPQITTWRSIAGRPTLRMRKLVMTSEIGE